MDFYCCDLDLVSGSIGRKEKMDVVLNERTPNSISCYFKGSKLLFLEEGNLLCGVYFR